MDRKHLERILRINGVSPSATDEQIREVLISAKYRDEEIQTALVVLRENAVAGTTRIDGLHKVFRTDGLLNPSEVSRLLGIEITADPSEARARREARRRSFSRSEHLLIIVLSLLLAVGGLAFAMRVLEFGVFHPTAALLIYDTW